ncbi:MAG: hypothetical protein QXN37_02980, partial [Candidatus Anstonellaceae archaeon]
VELKKIATILNQFTISLCLNKKDKLNAYVEDIFFRDQFTTLLKPKEEQITLLKIKEEQINKIYSREKGLLINELNESEDKSEDAIIF